MTIVHARSHRCPLTGAAWFSSHGWRRSRSVVHANQEGDISRSGCGGEPHGGRAGDFPLLEVIRLPRNMGAAGRTAGLRRAQTPYVAFADDDSWWAPGSLEFAEALLDAHPGWD
jgi:hypothetical protein